MRNLRVASNQLQIGDLLLSGGSDFVSLIIQLLTWSRFSHAALYVGLVDGIPSVLEAYDFSLTPSECDEGVSVFPLEKYLERVAKSGANFMVMRPDGLDTESFRKNVEYFQTRAARFPSTGIALLGLCLVANVIQQLLPVGWRSLPWEPLLRVACDGTGLMHCSEAATRIYFESGFEVAFGARSLDRQIAQAHAVVGHDALLPLSTGLRTANVGAWPRESMPRVFRYPLNTPWAINSAVEAVRCRAGNRHGLDFADLTMPGDYEAAQPFTRVIALRRVGGDWVPAMQ